jgi:hypothetical protein
MTPEDRALVVVLRETQWLLDDAAHEIPSDRYSTEKCLQLAEMLTTLATLVGNRARSPITIDHEANP